VEPDIITYSTIVKGYCLEGDVDRAFSVLDDMKSDEKFAPDEIMYNSILDGCAKQHRVEDALKVLDEMKSTGIIPSNYTLSILVKLLGHARRLNQAFRMVEELSTQHGFRPNVQVYTCLVQACVHAGQIQRALTTFATMQKQSVIPDSVAFGVVIGGCLTTGMLAEGTGLAKDALQQRKGDSSQALQPEVLKALLAASSAASPTKRQCCGA